MISPTWFSPSSFLWWFPICGMTLGVHIIATCFSLTWFTCASNSRPFWCGGARACLNVIWKDFCAIPPCWCRLLAIRAFEVASDKVSWSLNLERQSTAVQSTSAASDIFNRASDVSCWFSIIQFFLVVSTTLGRDACVHELLVCKGKAGFKGGTVMPILTCISKQAGIERFLVGNVQDHLWGVHWTCCKG